MRAAVARGLGQGFAVEDVDLAAPVGREVLVEVRASGLCHSDLHLVESDFGFPMPAVFGHEVAGVVTRTGPAAAAVRPGDHVVACLLQFCGHCEECAAGHSFACVTPGPTLRGTDQPARLTQGQAPITQAYGIGGFAERVLVHENQLAVVSKDIGFAQACVIGCATVTGAGAAINAAQVRVGDTVAVIGTGGVGLNVINGARLAGALQIIAIDVQDSKLAAAKRFGATHTVNAAEVDPVAAVRELTGRGVHHVFEVVGLPRTQQQAPDMARPGGCVWFVGLAEPGATLTVPSSLSMLRAHTSISGVHMGSTDLKRDIPMYVELYLQGRLNLDDLVTQEIGIGDIDLAYEQLKRGEVVRSVITTF